MTGVHEPAWPIETTRLLLRRFEPSDLEALYGIHSDEENARWLYNEPRTLVETRELLELKAAGRALSGEGQWLSAAVTLRATGELVGDVSLLWASEARQGELGFIFHPAHQGNGYATEAAQPLRSTAWSGASSRAIEDRPGSSRSSGCVARRTSSRTSG